MSLIGRGVRQDEVSKDGSSGGWPDSDGRVIATFYRASHARRDGDCYWA